MTAKYSASKRDLWISSSRMVASSESNCRLKANVSWRLAGGADEQKGSSQGSAKAQHEALTVAFICLMTLMHGSLERPVLQCNWFYLSVQVLELLWEVTQEAEGVKEREAEERDSVAVAERDSAAVVVEMDCEGRIAFPS